MSRSSSPSGDSGTLPREWKITAVSTAAAPTSTTVQPPTGRPIIKRILQYAAIAAGLWVAVQITGLDFSGTIWEFLGVSLLLFLANMIVRPILKVLSFPVILLTLGLFLLVVNAVVLQLVVWLSEPDRLNLGLTSSGFLWATFLGALVISIVRAILDFFFIKD